MLWLINASSRQVTTERAQHIAWDPTFSAVTGEACPLKGGGNETEEGIVCGYLLDNNAVGYYSILLRALNKVFMGEVIFVIKLALTLAHKSWVLVLKKLLNMPPLPHTVLLLNTLILLQIFH